MRLLNDLINALANELNILVLYRTDALGRKLVSPFLSLLFEQVADVWFYVILVATATIQLPLQEHQDEWDCTGTTDTRHYIGHRDQC